MLVVIDKKDDAAVSAEPESPESPENSGSPESGDADGLIRAMRALEPALRRFIATRVRAPEDVDDVLQEVAARILARKPSGPVEKKTAFLFSIASNLIRDRNRRGQVRRDSEHVALDDVVLADPAALQDQVVDARLRLRRLSAAIEKLPRDQRRVFLLHRVEGRTLADVASETGLSVAQVRKLVERAMTRLARKVWGE